MSKKLFMGLIAMSVSLPAIVAPVHAQEVRTEVKQDFKDVPKTHSAYKEIMAMHGIIDGYTDNTFKPKQAISRAHVASSLVRSLDFPPVRVGKEFKDVPKTSSYYAVVQKVYRAGIFDGKTDGTFGIDDNLTRAQMAKVLVNAFDLDIQKGNIFSDISKDYWAKDYISTLYISGITVGSNGKYMPNDKVSRAHYATFLFRALNLNEAPKIEPVPPNPGPIIVPRPEPKPEPLVESNPFASVSLQIPDGWNESKIEEHKKVIADTVYKYAPKRGTGMQFGKSSYNISDFNDPTFLQNINQGLKNINSKMTSEDWVADVKKAIETGELVIAEDYSYGIYIMYYKSFIFIEYTR